ncbi:unnamed protein product [Didymodactylos carnosus]|uniref:MHD domain-containing protein n=1 Tax=Didymodactylos carnosus TaxID=1234261 RepID=A0A814DLK4_9BILA|nr:unnamed protein product [Didymodactylos carnosus]CAF0958773.1 unnamed protein product [Didymodactylos carnosus]CAF3693070.1 unnamed protein product [Didymodactylos carnosus]CAF3733585.1 unnamed protein product [Didymodactylos carnosus]
MLISITGIRELRHSTIGFQVLVEYNYNPVIVGEKIELRSPIPTNACRVRLAYMKGKAKYKSSEKAILWKLKLMIDMKEYQLGSTIELQVPFAPSGFKVRYLKVFGNKLNYDDTQTVILKSFSVGC